MTDEQESEARLFQALSWIGYTNTEIKAAITFFNSCHDIKINEYAQDIAVGMLVRIIERSWKK